VVDDDPSFLGGMVRLLSASDYSVEGYNSAKEFLAKRPADAEGCVLIDLQMPDMDGLELQKALNNSDNPLTVVFLSGAGDIPTSVEAIRKGAEDFLTKTAPKEELSAVIERAFERDRRERLQSTRKRELLKRFSRLTSRENEVLERVLRGQPNKQIAWDLDISERSVKRHRTNLMSKLNVNSVAELVTCAIEVGHADDTHQPDPA
jgi:FixJ family two-component response regulator